jgi:hypothetical protein
VVRGSGSGDCAGHAWQRGDPGRRRLATSQPAERGTIEAFQPQIATSKPADFTATVRWRTMRTGRQETLFGTIKLMAETEVSAGERLVRFESLKIVEANFQTLPKERVQEIVVQIRRHS